MKRIIASLAAVLLLAACGSKKNQFTLTVHLSDELAGENVYFSDFATNEIIRRDTTSGMLRTFTGTVDEPFVAIINVGGGRAYGICFIEPGEIYIDPVIDSLSGTPLNDAYNAALFTPAYRAARDNFYAQYWRYIAAEQTGDAALKSELNPILDSLYSLWQDPQKEAYRKLLADHPNDLLGAQAIVQLSEECKSAAELELLLEGCDSVIRQYAPIRTRLEQLQVLDRTAIGAHYIDFQGTDYKSGSTTTLSQMIDGKLTLIDVWASWCGPCRAEITENLLRIHKEYKDKGLFLLGITVDQNLENHAKATQALGIEYDQLIDSESQCCDLYGIQGIPHILLISPDGTILARDLRGNQIEEAVKAALQ